MTSPVRLGNGAARRWLMRAGLLVWLVVVVGGLLLLIDHSSAPGESLASQGRWPRGTALARDSRRPTLLLFLHPRCPCSRSALEALARLLSDRNDEVRVVAVAFRPENMPESWARSGNWQKAAPLADDMRVDHNAEEARRFGVATSGHVLLYDSAGRLRFSGGITSGRGHDGDSPGRDALELAIDQCVRGAPAPAVTFPVYGCGIVGQPGRGDANHN